MTRLDEIVARTRRQLQSRIVASPLASLESRIVDCLPVLDLAAALGNDGLALIAEVKKASPSRGPINPGMDHVAVAEAYACSGAAAISVLTEPEFFHGGLDDLRDIAASPVAHRVPLLRKDFIVDPYQVYETRACGADAVLLIVAILEPGALASLLALSHALGMRCLVETHDEAELATAVDSGARIIGINNRNLRDFAVDVSTFERLSPHVPAGRLVVAESGIRTPADVKRMAAAGADAVLIGEALAAAGDIAGRIREFQCRG